MFPSSAADGAGAGVRAATPHKSLFPMLPSNHSHQAVTFLIILLFLRD
jgi:hypothetical protein